MKKKNLIIASFFCLFLSLLIVSCVKDKAKSSETIPANNCDTVSYAQHVKPIIDANCLSCHGNNNPSGGFPLTAYSQLKEKAVSGKIKATVIDNVAPTMPPTGPLSKLQKNLITCWLSNGYKE